MGFWDNYDLLEKIFIFVAAPATILLLIQLVLQLIGIGGDQASTDAGADTGIDAGSDSIGEFESDAADGADSDADTIGEEGRPSGVRALRVFTFQGAVAFFAIAGWTGLLFAETLSSDILAVLLAVICGAAAMVGLAYIMRLLLGLQSDGTVNVRNALGLQGVVYLRVPAARSGKGQVSVMIQERYREYDAVTYENTEIATGSAVRVIDILSDSILVVEKLD